MATSDMNYSILDILHTPGATVDDEENTRKEDAKVFAKADHLQNN